jgi:DNA-binding SARP family transcriptional activator
MLKVLIAFGGNAVIVDQIEDALWPDADGDVAHHSFEMTLHRLRKLIGHEKAIEYREGRVTLDPAYFWVDVWAFERILGGIDDKKREELTDSAALITQKAIEMYWGPFLAGEVEQSWMVSIRERLRRKFLRNVSWLANYWEQSQSYDRALECYERGLEVDELAEELYRHLIICYQRLGRQAEALSVYRRCKRTLSASLGIEPSSETEAIYRTILTQKR